MKKPVATYRVQLSADFTFKQLREIIPYLRQLGISTIYASPVFKARAGSTHGYDVVDPHQVNPEIGTLDEWREISRELKQNDMTWLQDIVPNHMAFDHTNLWLQSIFELGPQSPYYRTFDIDWNHPDERFTGKVMAPFLGDEPEKVLEQKQLLVSAEEDGFYISYYEHKYRLSLRSYSIILEEAAKITGDSSFTEEITSQIEQIEDALNSGSLVRHEPSLLEFLRHPSLKPALDKAIKAVNDSPEKLNSLLEQQYFRFVHWKSTEREINYRRFFTINDLICLRMEDEKVFEQYHSFIRQLCEEGLIDGLRIDHIDGLFAPRQYLQRLQQYIGERRYIIIEKILEWKEFLPSDWPMHGSSGYGFLASVNQLFTRPDAEEDFSDAYTGITTEITPYDHLVYEKKKFIMEERMGGELRNLYNLMESKGLLPDNGNPSPQRWMTALMAFLSAYPVYRIYFREFPITTEQRRVLEEVYQKAMEKLPEFKAEFDHLLQLFEGQNGGTPDEQYFVQRCQQFTGPLAAKGVEDTSFYIYNRLISHNEVGDTPANFGIYASEFHDKMIYRRENFPHSINATATHDTKRGEDARLRINTLSEVPDEWFARVEEWTAINSVCKAGNDAPDANEEYFIYQALIGAWPVDGHIDESFVQRTQEYVLKMLREAKLHSAWSAPDEAYEKAVLGFVKNILQSPAFTRSFAEFAQRTTFYGALYSLGQCIIKTTAPGVPDIYQGTELWDLSYVDPDNRRPVDYRLRNDFLQTFAEPQVPALSQLDELMTDYLDGRLKMYVLHKTLKLRQGNPELFTVGEYFPLNRKGPQKRKVIGYARRLGDEWVIVVVPYQVIREESPDDFPVGAAAWGDAELQLPDDIPPRWKNIFSGEEQSFAGSLPLKEAFSRFPVAVLKSIAHEV